MEDIVIKETAKALSETFKGPLGELGQLVSDRIRFARWQKSIEILKRAKEIASRKGVELTHPEIKFLVPFLEKSSLEGNDPDIHELWANLLVSASTRAVPNRAIITDILGKLDGEHVRFLNRLCSGTPSHWIEEVPHDAAFQLLSDRLESIRSQYSERSSPRAGLKFNGDSESVFNFIAVDFDKPGRKMEFFSVDTRENRGSGGWELTESHFEGFDFEILSGALESLGLVRTFAHFAYEFPNSLPDLHFYIVGASITKFGVDLMMACGFEGANSSESDIHEALVAKIGS